MSREEKLHKSNKLISCRFLSNDIRISFTTIIVYERILQYQLKTTSLYCSIHNGNKKVNFLFCYKHACQWYHFGMPLTLAVNIDVLSNRCRICTELLIVDSAGLSRCCQSCWTKSLGPPHGIDTIKLSMNVISLMILCALISIHYIHEDGH